MSEPIRLACVTCDRDDCDGIHLADAEAAGWERIGFAPGTSEFEWWTHLGWCPDCVLENLGPDFVIDHEP